MYIIIHKILWGFCMYNSIKASELKGMIGRINIIDIRKSFLYNLGSIPSSKNIPSSFLLIDPSKYLDKDKEYIVKNGTINILIKAHEFRILKVL